MKKLKSPPIIKRDENDFVKPNKKLESSLQKFLELYDELSNNEVHKEYIYLVTNVIGNVALEYAEDNMSKEDVDKFQKIYMQETWK